VHFGLESLSRGAKLAVLCDKSHKAMNIIKQNVEKTKTSDETVLINNSFERALKEIKFNDLRFDIIFLDPPYESSFAVEAVEEIMKLDLLNENGIIIIETYNKEITIENKLLEIYDKRKYGTVHLIFLKRS